MIQTFYYVEILKIQNTCIITCSWPQGTCRLFMTCRLKFLLMPWNYITFEFLICLFVSDYPCFICLHIVQWLIYITRVCTCYLHISNSFVELPSSKLYYFVMWFARQSSLLEDYQIKQMQTGRGFILNILIFCYLE